MKFNSPHFGDHTSEILEASSKLKPIYKNLIVDLSKEDEFTENLTSIYIPNKEKICSSKIEKTEKYLKLGELKKENNMSPDNQEDLYIDIIWRNFLPTTEYTQNLNSHNELIAETDLDNKQVPINYWSIAKDYGNKYNDDKNSWLKNLYHIVQYDSCDVDNKKLLTDYFIYNNILKKDFKNHMKKIEEFYNNNELDLNELKKYRK